MEIFLLLLSILLITAVFLSFVKNDFWVFKIFEYPRLQKLFLVFLVLILWLAWWPKEIFFQVVFAILACSFVYLLYKIWPYTVLAKKEMKQVRSSDAANEIKLFAANVLQENRDYEKMLQQINTCHPDIIFLLETDHKWAEAMKELEKKYPYKLIQAQENTYGLLFYSSLPLENASVKFLVKEDIPSVEARIVLPSGKKIQLWGVHPEPPVPGETLYSTAKDKELMKIAFKANECKLPCIVTGDLNDVAWSHTTELFRKTSNLLDPRRGRGFYSTFSAHHWYIRYPLDYIFCSSHFGLIRMKRLPQNGSDHFATFTHLILMEELKNEQEEPKASSKEAEEAREVASKPLKE